MKKSLIFFIIVAMIFCGCETFKNLQSKIAEKVKTVAKTAGAEAGKKMQIPQSYEKSDSFRTGKPDAEIQKFVRDKKNDAMRSTKPNDYVKALCEKINSAGQNDFHRAKMAHDAVSLLVLYDAQGFWSGNVPEQNWERVLKTKTAVCEGYSNLYKHFCDSLKIPCIKIHGYARGVGTSIADEKFDENHAWNAVQIDDEWYLVDSTWDSGYMSGRKSVQKYGTEWLFCRPEAFLHSHFPSMKNQQLVEKPLEKDEFANLAYMRPTFFEIADFGEKYFAKTQKCEGKFEFAYKKKQNLPLSLEIRDGKTGKIFKNCVFVLDEGNKATIKINAPKAGTFHVNLFYWKTERSGEGCGEFFLESSVASAEGFAEFYSSAKSKVEKPLSNPLKKGQKCDFAVISDKKFVALICGNEFRQFKSDGKGRFSLETEIPKNVPKISIGIANKEKGSYNIIASYNVK